MAKLEDLIASKLDLYENADDIFLDDIEKTQNSIAKKVISILNKFDTEGGNLVNNETTMQLIVSLTKDITKILNSSTYSDKVSKYLKKFDEMQRLNKELAGELNGIKLTKVNLNPIKTDAINNITNSLVSKEAKSTGLVQPIKDIVFQSVVTGMPIEEAKQRLRNFIQGTPKRNGHMMRYVSQIARDALTQYDGLVNDVIRKEYNLDGFQYVGSLVDDSRPQCIRWVGKEFIEFEDLPTEISWAFSNGQGMIPGTTPENFARFRGGYNCRHMAIPVRIDKEKKQEIAEAAEAIPESNNPPLKTSLFASNRDEETNNAMLSVLALSDGFNKIANDNNTIVTLRNSAQTTNKGSFKFATDNNLDSSKVASMGSSVNGHCAVNNSFMSVKLKRGDFVKFEKVENIKENTFFYDKEDLEDFLKDNKLEESFLETSQGFYKMKSAKSGVLLFKKMKDDKYRVWSIRQLSAIKSKTGQNITPTILHESAHLIHFNVDNQFGTKLSALAKKEKVKLSDSLTEYGSTSWAEFFAEHYTAYVLMNAEFKAANKDLYDFFEKKVFKEFSIDKSTITIAE